MLSIPEPTSLSGGKRTVQINTEQLEGCLTPFLQTQRLNPNPKSLPFILNCKTVIHNP